MTGAVRRNLMCRPATGDDRNGKQSDPVASLPVLNGPDGGSMASPGAVAYTGVTLSTSSAATSSPLVINLSWDGSVSSAPSGFIAAVTAAAHYLESQFTDPITVNLSIGYGEVAGTPNGGRTWQN